MVYDEIPLYLRPGLRQVVISKGLRIARNQLPSCGRIAQKLTQSHMSQLGLISMT